MKNFAIGLLTGAILVIVVVPSAWLLQSLLAR